MDFLGYDIPMTVDTDNVRRMKDEEVGALCPLVPMTPTKPIATRAQPFFSSGIQGNQQKLPSWLESVMSPDKFTQGSSQSPIGEANSLKSTGYPDPNIGARREAGSSSRPRVYDDVNSSETLLLNDSDTNFSDLLSFVGMDSGTSRTVPTPSSCSGHIPHYGYPVSCHPGYNFSSPQKNLTSMVSNNSILFSQFEPITPHQSVRAQQYQGSDKGKAYLAQGPNMEKRNTIDLSHEGSLQQSVVDSPSPFVSESFTEMNRTPQQKPKRKKVRPKVVKQAEHKRTPKANNNLNTNQSTTTESLTGKRKYVRRNSNKSPNVLPAEAVVEVTTDYAATSCKRSLNFSSEDHSNKVDQQEGLLHNIVDDRSTLSFGIERTSLHTQALRTGSSGTIYGQQPIQELEVVDDSLAGVLFDLSCSLMPQKTAPATPPPIRNEPARGRFNIFSCNSNIGIGSQEVGESSCPPGIQDHPTESLCGVIKNRNHCSNHENGVPYLFHDDTRYMDNENTTYKSHLRLAEVQEATTLQRGYNHNETEANFVNKAGKSYLSLPVYAKMLQQYQQQGKSSDLQQQFSETCKKKRTQNDQYPVSRSISAVEPILHGARESTECRMNDASTSHFASQTSNKGMTIQYGNVNEQRLHKTETSMYDVQSHADSKGQPQPAWPLCDPADGNNMVQEQYALVPCGGDGQMVPYEGKFDPVMKRKHRARVHLDPETERVWKLLMGTDASNGVEETNEDKEKWWQKERHVLHGRAHSFIARMHLIQGDRSFTKWKGSVLDSIIGVFLTQNVSDHLSSSAFMSLAARFPLKSTDYRPHYNAQQDKGIVVEEHNVCQDSISDLKKTLKRPISDQGAATLYESENMEKRECGNSNASFGSNTRGGMLGITSSQSSVVSSQSAVDSSMAQRTSEDGAPYQNSANLSFPCTDERIKWCSETNPLSRCASNSFSNSISFTDLLQSVDTSMLQGYSGKQRTPDKVVETNSRGVYSLDKVPSGTPINPPVPKEIPDKGKKKEFDWDSLRKEIPQKGLKTKRDKNAMDSLDWEAVRCADVGEIAEAIKERGMKNMLAERIKDFLNRLVNDHGSIDMEWLRDVPPGKAKEYLLSIRGLGLKSVECVRLLTLHQVAFPVDINVARIAVRLGWVPLQPLPESLQLHHLELYPMLESVQKYLWPRLCTLDQPTLYELHYQMITFGKVFCTKSKPNCNACPMRAECKHFASAFASSRLSLPGPEEKGMVASFYPISGTEYSATCGKLMPLLEADSHFRPRDGEPLVEEPASPVYSSTEVLDTDIEDAFYEPPNVSPSIKHNLEEFTLNLESFMQENYKGHLDGEVSNALVAVSAQAASIAIPRLKNVSRLRTEHYVYELPDDHRILIGVPRRDPDDHCKYLLAIWTPGETAESIQPPEGLCVSQASGNLCNEKTCFSCNSKRETNTQTVRGTLLIPCRSAMRGNFPLNGTYFQVNEVFADNESSLEPISVPREWIWNLPRRTVLFGTSISAIFKDQSTEEIQNCFRKGYVCVRGFDQKTRTPQRLLPRLHFPASMLAKSNAATKKD